MSEHDDRLPMLQMLEHARSATCRCDGARNQLTAPALGRVVRRRGGGASPGRLPGRTMPSFWIRLGRCSG
jgi:hypothetical protein